VWCCCVAVFSSWRLIIDSCFIASLFFIFLVSPFFIGYYKSPRLNNFGCESLANPRTRCLTEITGVAFRLTAADREFLSDLSKVQMIDRDCANRWHYAHLKGGCESSLSRLVKAGVLTEKKLHAHGVLTHFYQFSSHEMARAWGGKLPVTGARRSDLHELVASRLYFELNRPADFRLENRFSREDQFQCGSYRPDAMFTDAQGDVVFVEANSGQYTRTQISEKMDRWSALGVKQVWGQPKQTQLAFPLNSAMVTSLTV